MDTALTFRNLYWIIWSPSHAFRQILEHPNWLAPFLAIGMGSTLITWLTFPLLQEAVIEQMSVSIPSADLKQVREVNRTVHYVATIATLPSILLLWFFSSFAIWLIVQVLEGLAEFKMIFSLVAYSNMTTFIAGVLMAGISIMKVQTGQATVDELAISIGLDLLWHGELHPITKTVLMNINPFSFWYYGLLVLGLSRICALKRLQAAFAVAIFWSLQTLFAAGATWVKYSISAG